MIKIDMELPRECHDCPFQLRFKDDDVNDWYMRRCVITKRVIKYPKPEWCPLLECKSVQSGREKAKWIRTGEDGYCSNCKCDMPMFKEDWKWVYCETDYCPNCGAKMECQTDTPED